MHHNVYFDLLDTAQTALGGTEEQRTRAEECSSRAEAEIKMSVLCGLTPVFPQTHGWDSGALLEYAGRQSLEQKSFLWLLEKGYIRVCLRDDNASIWDAARAAFRNPAYRRLSAWPEFKTRKEREPLVEAMDNTKRWAALPSGVGDRLDVLRRLSEAARKAPGREQELPRRDSLSRLIKKAAGAASGVDREVARLLWRCTGGEVPDPNNRTAIDEFLEGEMQNGQWVPPEVRQVTDACYNAVAAGSVQAHPILTFPLAGANALEIMGRTLPGSMSCDVLAGSVQRLESYEVADLEPVSWERIEEHMKKVQDSGVASRIREAEAAKLIANVAGPERPRYALIPPVTGKLYGSTVGWAAGTLVATLAGAIPGLLAGILIGAVGSTLAERSERARVVERLERKWLGLIQQRRSMIHERPSTSLER